MPPRRQRKRKTQTALNDKEFIAAISDSFDEGVFDEASFKDMFNDLKELNNFNTYLESYSTEFYERVVCGCTGILNGIKELGAPLNYSMLSCQEEQLEEFCKAFEEFSQRYAILRNFMDTVFTRWLTAMPDIQEQHQKRLLKIMALFIKVKVYNKSKKEDFFLNAMTRVPNSHVAIIQCLTVFKNTIGEEQTFNFIKLYNFLQAIQFEDFEKETFLKDQNMQWLVNLIENLKHQQQLEESKEKSCEAFKKQENLKEILDQYKELYPDQKNWIEFLLKAASGALDPVKQGIEKNQQIFNQIVPFLKLEVTTVPLQGFVMGHLMKICYQHPHLNDLFKPCLMILYTNEIIDGNVIVAWYERAEGNGKATFGKQVFKFVNWLKSD